MKKLKKKDIPSLFPSSIAEGDEYKMFMIQTLNQINLQVSETDLKKAYDEYVDVHSLNKKLKTLNIDAVTTAAKLCWMLSQGMMLNEKDERLILEHVNKHEELLVDKVAPVILPKRIKASSGGIDYSLLTVLDMALDKEQYDINLRALIHPLVNLLTLEDTLSVFEGYANELVQALADEELMDGYKCMTKQKFNIRLKFIQQCIMTLKQGIVKKKSYDSPTEIKPRVVKEPKLQKPKTVKPSSLSKKVEGFKFGQSIALSDSFTITSEHPLKLLSANAVLLFNNQYKTITLLAAEEGKTLDVHGTTIKNIDESASLSKRMRHHVDTIQTIFNSGGITRNKVKKQIELLKTKPSRITGRSSDQTYILKTFK
jgi:hypothetical protein